MEIKDIWMSPDSAGKSRFALGSIGGVLGISALALLLAGGGTVLMLRRGLSVQAMGLGLCVLVTALVLFLAFRLGRRRVQDATVFFLTEEDRLFALDAREMTDYGGNTVDNLLGDFRTQRLLRELARRPELPGRAREIVVVEKLKDRGGSLAAVCLVQNMSGRRFRRTYFLVRGLDREEELIRQLERRRSWRSGPEERDSPYALQITLWTLALFGCAALGILSHPAIGKLPRCLYYPSLPGQMVACFFLLWTLVRRRRGE